MTDSGILFVVTKAHIYKTSLTIKAYITSLYFSIESNCLQLC